MRRGGSFSSLLTGDKAAGEAGEVRRALGIFIVFSLERAQCEGQRPVV